MYSGDQTHTHDSLLDHQTAECNGARHLDRAVVPKKTYNDVDVAKCEGECYCKLHFIWKFCSCSLGLLQNAWAVDKTALWRISQYVDIETNINAFHSTHTISRDNIFFSVYWNDHYICESWHTLYTCASNLLQPKWDFTKSQQKTPRLPAAAHSYTPKRNVCGVVLDSDRIGRNKWSVAKERNFTLFVHLSGEEKKCIRNIILNTLAPGWSSRHTLWSLTSIHRHTQRVILFCVFF